MGQKNSKIQITEADRAVLQLKKSKDDIHKFTKRTDTLIGNEKLELKQLIKDHPYDYKENTKVRFLLKRIHYQENLVQQASDQLINLENMVSNIEFKIIESQFLSGLQMGNQILAKLNREFKDVDTVIEDVQEQIAYQNEIDETLSSSIVGVDNFEEEIDKELDRLELEINPDRKIEMPSIDGLPALSDNSMEKEEVQPSRKAKLKSEGATALPS